MRPFVIVIFAAVFITACTGPSTSSRTVGLGDPPVLHGSPSNNSPRVYDIQRARFGNNYRLKFYMDEPEKALLKTSGNTMEVRMPRFTVFTVDALATLKQQVTPCIYEGSRTEEYLVLVFQCKPDVKIYPESGRNYIDLIMNSPEG